MKLLKDILRRAAATLAILGVFLSHGPTTWAAESDGRIVFTSRRDGDPELYIMDGDGSNVTRLTNRTGFDQDADISPDGRKVVWTKSAADGGPAEICEINVDGTNERRLSLSTGSGVFPRYSPDGASVVFCEYFPGNGFDLRIVDLRDLSVRTVMSTTADEMHPDWSPDGKQIVFDVYVGSDRQIASVDIATGIQTQLTAALTRSSDPSWSSTGKIAFNSGRTGNTEIFVMDKDGANDTQITTFGNNTTPAWNPDGSKIVFTNFGNSTPTLYSINADGTSPKQLTQTGPDMSPSWGSYPAALSGRTVQIDDVTIVEGDSGAQLAQLTVRLSGAATVPVSVNFATADGTALAGSDYTAGAGTVFFAPGETEKAITVLVTGDNNNEGDENFNIALSNPLGATLSDGQATVTIFDDERFPQVKLNSQTVTEGNTGNVDVVLTATLSGPSTKTVKVNYVTVNGTAIEGSDYRDSHGTLTFDPGVTTRNITVQVMGDIRFEPNESLTVELSNPANARLAAFPNGSIVITNDDAGPLPPTEFTIDFPINPALNALPRIEGKVRDYAGGGGIEKVEVSLKRLKDGFYWSGTWAGTTPSTLEAELRGTDKLTWKIDRGLPLPGSNVSKNLTEGEYLISAKAVNVDGQELVVTRTFAYDGTLPEVTVTTPANGALLR